MFIVVDLMVGSLYDLIKHGKINNETMFKSGFDIDFVIKVLYDTLKVLAANQKNCMLFKASNSMGFTRLIEKLLCSVNEIKESLPFDTKSLCDFTQGER